MEENPNSQQNSQQEQNHWQMRNHYRGHFLLRLFIGIVILIVVFCLGVAVGSSRGSFGRGEFHGREGYRMFKGYGYPAPMPYPMMAPGWPIQFQPATSTPAK